MSNELMNIGFKELKEMSVPMAACKFFGFKSADEALALMMIAQAEGMHPALAAKEYHVINGKPALKADAMLSRFQKNGGFVKWSRYDDECVSGEFSHPQGGSVSITWDIARANKAGLTSNPTWKKYPAAMLRSRCISEGIRTVFPGVIAGFYTEEEAESLSPPTKRDNGPVIVDAEYKSHSQQNDSEPRFLEEECVVEDVKTISQQFVDEATILRAKATKCIERNDTAVLKVLVMDWYRLCHKYTTEHDGFVVPQKWAEGMHQLLLLEKPLSIQKGYIDFGGDNIVHLDEVIAVKTADNTEEKVVNS